MTRTAKEDSALGAPPFRTRMAPLPKTGAPAAVTEAQLFVVIPALNEEATIGDVIRGIPQDIPGVARVRVLVVNDGSTDRTAQNAVDAGAEVVHHSRPLGVGAAFQSGLNRAIDAGADLVVNIDGDGQFNPADIPKLVAPVVSGTADFATASRFKDPALMPEMHPFKRWGNRMMSRLISRLCGQRFHDVSCGMRCYNRTAALSLNLIGQFTYTQEAFMNLAYKGRRIIEVPIRVRGRREHGQSRVAGNLLRYALKTSRIIFRCYRDYHPMRFFGRIALWLLIGSLALAAFFLWHYLTTGGFSPHKWAGFLSGGLGLLSLIMLVTGMIGDMLNRHRIYLEELLYRQRLNQRREE
jgi:glycosyltransferase involved in cell wall biosynthesis